MLRMSMGLGRARELTQACSFAPCQGQWPWHEWQDAPDSRSPGSISQYKKFCFLSAVMTEADASALPIVRERRSPAGALEAQDRPYLALALLTQLDLASSSRAPHFSMAIW